MKWPILLLSVMISALIITGCQPLELQQGNGVKIPNPASAYCEEQGGVLGIVTAEDGSQSGICTLKDGTQCDEWKYFRGECPLEGMVGAHTCTDEEKAAEACTMEYVPVCGDNGLTYGNKCSACASKAVKAWIPGECKTGKYAIAKTQLIACSEDSDCELPMHYAVQSNCPYQMKCIEGKCNVICPGTTQEEYDLVHKLTEKDRQCEECPQLAPPGPTFCTDGTIIAGAKDECGCATPPRCEKAVACTEEAKICPDGSAVGRTGPNCEFAPCPTDGKLKAVDCKDPRPQACTKEYVPVCGQVEVRCIKAPCPPVMQTFGNKCEACANPLTVSYTEGECKTAEAPEKTYCTEGQRGAIACTMQYDPVCGSDGRTYGNACSACSAANVEYHTPGECD